MATINYDNRWFVSVENTPNGDVGDDTMFHYHQEGNLVWATYAGGSVLHGQLIALVDDNGELDMRYHHVNTDNEIRTGVCRAIPEILPDGRIRLHEQWQWTSGDRSNGQSVSEEMNGE